MSYKKNFKIKNLLLDSNVVYAPLAEYTDFAFRRLIRRYHKGLMFCEMIKMEALIREKSYKILKHTMDMFPLGAQLCGADPEIASEAAKIIESLGFDIIDLNCGCPVPKVVKDGSGSALLKNPSLVYKLLNIMNKSVKIPVTVKIRIGWDDESINAKEILKIAQDTGCSAITIHGRTKKQGYSGKSNLSYIKECKEEAKNILVFGNGDLFNPEAVSEMFNTTNCDGVMIARGLLYNPNISNDVENYFLGKGTNFSFDKKDAILKYIEYLVEEKGSQKAVFDIRRISGWLLRDIKDVKHLRIAINMSDDINEIIRMINDFNWSYEKEVVDSSKSY